MKYGKAWMSVTEMNKFGGCDQVHVSSYQLSSDGVHEQK